MKIAQIAPFEESVPPKKYGGTELVIYNLTKGLVEKNHRVVLFASADSKTKAKLFPIFHKPLRENKDCSEPKIREAYKFLGVGETVKALMKERFDIIHNHIGWRFLPFAQLFKTPILTTLHGPLNIGYQKMIYRKYPNLFYVSISKAQRKPLKEINFVANIYNGVELKNFAFNEKPEDYLAFLGRMSPEKGPLEAIKIAKKANKNLIMSAKIDAVDQEYFLKIVKPEINGEQIKFIGEINHQKKVPFLKNAKALLAPLNWEEPFGLFMAEAMACGTPVIAFRRGSVPEIIEHGKTGFVVKNIDEAAEAVKRIDEIKREDCRKRVEKKFSLEKMVKEYEKVYNEIIRKKTI